MSNAEILQEATKLIANDNLQVASILVKTEYPFEKYVKPVSSDRKSSTRIKIVSEAEQRKYTQKQALELFIADSFIDRYSGEKLVLPSALYALSTIIPDAFPCGNKRSSTHQAFWDLFPSLDHIEPVSGGGKDVDSNWITTSMAMNIRKSNIPLSELGWQIYQRDTSCEWDGLVSWYLEWADENENAQNIRLNKGWHAAITSLFPGPYPFAA